MRDRCVAHPHGLLRLVRMRARGGPRHVVIDVDGCLTDGSIYQSADGSKLVKVFGPDDHDAINLIKSRGIAVTLVTADTLGLGLAQQRADHMNCQLVLATQHERAHDLPFKCPIQRAVYIGDGFYDDEVMRHYGLGIAPQDAYPRTRRTADVVTSRPGGHRAVAQALEFLLRWVV